MVLHRFLFVVNCQDFMTYGPLLIIFSIAFKLPERQDLDDHGTPQFSFSFP